MKAWQLERAAPLTERPLRLVDLPDPVARPGEIVIEITYCGLCRTDIHIVQGEIDLPVLPIVPGHQAVGKVIEGEGRFAIGDRVGVAWLNETCGSCPDCARDDENLCRAARFTGYHRNGGFAERIVVREEFAYRLPEALDDAHAAPLLCSGIIGYRALCQADLGRDEIVGLYGFGSSAHVAIQVAQARNNRVFVVTRGEKHRDLARRMGADWVGGPGEVPPEPLDRSVIFAPAGELIPQALEATRWGGTVSSAAIHMSAIPEMDYSRHLFGERTLRSTTASTRRDGEEMMRAAEESNIETEITIYEFDQVNEGLLAILNDSVQGSAVLRVRG